MSNVDWPVVADIFADALELPPNEREEFVAARCAGRPEVRAAVDRLLVARDDADPEFLTGVSRELLAEVAVAPVPLQRIGPWRLIREIGRGGMGQVFLAERADGQFDQQVAIKLLKRGMDSDAILARFLRERQILAALDHPNIARLIDGGVAEDGRPYFVMEHVDGESITAFADSRRLSIDARLQMLRTVCLAVEYAHRNLVVHRDLKPSNILVTTDGRPKLLDFGIAKLLTRPDDKAEAATLTSAGVRLLTPDYAAPEQFRGGPITTATDVYGLGAVMFELLAGRPPFDTGGGNADRDHDTEPGAVSGAAFRARGDTDPREADTIAEHRSTDAIRLRRRLAGDLDTIVATALRTIPERRYGSVAALNEDLRRHLEQLPVLARPDSLGYRASRFVRRHRAGVIGAGAIGILLVGFGISTVVQARALAAERDRAQLEATAAREVSEFLVGVFAVADPTTPGRGGEVSASELLDRGATRIDTELAGQPAVQARLLGVIGRAYDNLRQDDRAKPLLARAVALQRATSGPESAALVTALEHLARAHANGGEFPKAEAVLREAMSIQQRRAPDDAAMGGLLVDLAYVVHGAGDNEAGRVAVAEAIAFFNRLPAEQLRGSRPALLRMAEMLGYTREWERTDTVFSRLLEVERALAGPQSTQIAFALQSWAASKERRGDHAAAESLLAISAGMYESIKPGSLELANVLDLRATVAAALGDLVRADSLARFAVRIYRDRLGDEHRRVAIARAALSDLLMRRRLFHEAIEPRQLAQATFRRDTNDVNTLLPPTEWRLGVALRAVGRLPEAITAFESSLRTLEQRFPPNYIITANVRRDYGDALIDVGRPAEGERTLRLAVDGLAGRWGADDYRVDMARVSLGRALTVLGRRDEARRVLTEALNRLVVSRGAGDSITRRARGTLDGLERPRAGTRR